ncbi:putative bifunctional diguanylate cyclase/phosphodiesterase [Kineococcus terrestris]|uniref:putative bifunctional diguanylate cyclase/phosphodiesterase n=1 Tax=Kineococcus terrestris TaxID=2044856 RepID=UPI0034DB339B
MHVRPPATPAPVVPRALAAVLLAGALAAAGALAPGLDARAAGALLFVVQGTAWAQLRRTALLRPAERHVWGWIAGGAGVLAAGALLGLTGDLLSAAGAAGPLATWLDLAPRLSALAAVPFLYQGLVRWNPLRTYTSDSGDWVNGMSAVLTLSAVGVLAVRWSGSAQAAWSLPQLLAWAGLLGGLVVLVGTAVTVAVIGGLQRDLRTWAVTAVLVALTAAVLLLGSRDPVGGTPLQAVWALALLALAVTGASAPGVVPVPARAEVPTAGAIAVLFAAIVVLVLAGLTTSSGVTPTVLAGLAVLGVALRVGHLVHETALLAESRHQALTDDLTGVPNRRALVQRLEDLDAREGAALLVADVDRFKEVNDRWGHERGDELLRLVVAAAGEALPRRGLLARLGGDEFAVLLPGLDDAAAVAVARRVREAVLARVAVAGARYDVASGVGLSVGVATAGPGPLDADDLLRRADAAMYSVKTRSGPSAATGVEVFDRAVDERLRDRAALLADLRALLDPAGSGGRGARDVGELVVVHQPQVTVPDGVVVGAEALVRWRHPERGTLPPPAFLDLVEEHGLMDALTRVVLTTAVRDAAGWSVEGRPLRVSVNLSASTLASPALLDLVDEVLAASGFDPSRLVLEVTETALMADPGVALAVAHALTARGVQLSIDDYGTGYSSLAYLTDLPAAELKLDRAFTTRLLSEPRTTQVVHATVELAHRLGLRVVVEGTEDAATFDRLYVLGADESQGWLHGRPVPAAEFSRLLGHPAPASPSSASSVPTARPAGRGSR